MASLPLIERELRVALRKLNPPRLRLRTALWAVGVTAALILFAALTSSRHMGRTVQMALMLFGLVAVSRVPGRVAGAIAEERRNQTLGILFLSGMSSLDVFVGKLLSAAMIALNELLVIFPLLALPFILGGVSFDLFAATVCCLPNVLLFILALSLFASIMTKDEGAALPLTMILAGVICGIAPTIWLGERWFSGLAVLPPWLVLSPGYGVYLVFKNFAGASPHAFWLNAEVTLVWSLGLLLAAAIALRWIWRREAAGEGNTRTGWLAGWRKLARCDSPQRRYALTHWLDLNPAVWLELRKNRPLVLVWTSVGGITVLWLAAWAAWPQRWPSVPNFFITASLLNMVLQTIQGYATADCMASARRDGAFELLLTTPLKVGQFVRGHLQARREQFRRVIRFVFALELLMAVAGLVIRPWTPQALFTYTAIWGALTLWTWSLRGDSIAGVRVAWAALNSGRASFAIWGRAKLGSWYWIWILYNFSSLFRNVNAFPSGSTGELTLVGAGIVIVVLLGFAQRREGEVQLARLVREFRAIIDEPIPDPDDPRYKDWKMPYRDRFPWGPAGFQHQVIERAARRRAEQALSAD